MDTRVPHLAAPSRGDLTASVGGTGSRRPPLSAPPGPPQPQRAAQPGPLRATEASGGQKARLCGLVCSIDRAGCRAEGRGGGCWRGADASFLRRISHPNSVPASAPEGPPGHQQVGCCCQRVASPRRPFPHVLTWNVSLSTEFWIPFLSY